MSKRTLIALTAALTVSIVASSASAQERCKVKYDVPAANSKYTQQHMLDVGDRPGHQVGLFELHRTFANEQPNCEGDKRVEFWGRGWRDLEDRNGRAWGYSTTTLDNGDKMFGEWSGTVHSVALADGKRRSTYTGVTVYTGGSGKYAGLRGIERETVVFDPEKGLNESKSEGEYWLEK